jgi:2-C-methyl-D-erythritol 4-phosphate cytidylyltransferase
VKTTAIIVAAGTGSRFGSETPKQFVELAGRPVIVHTILRFVHAESVNSIIVVLGRQWLGFFEKTTYGRPFRMVEGGTTRAESVLNGLKALEPDTEIVVVHDGARPLVSSEDIDRTVKAAQESGAACLVARVTDTIKTVDHTDIIGTLDREKLRRALTPQAFRVDVLRRAFEVGDLNDSVTDECYLVERLGHPITTVDTTSPSLKITTPDDLLVAGALIGEFTVSEYRSMRELATAKAAKLKSEN